MGGGGTGAARAGAQIVAERGVANVGRERRGSADESRRARSSIHVAKSSERAERWERFAWTSSLHASASASQAMTTSLPMSERTVSLAPSPRRSTNHLLFSQLVEGAILAPGETDVLLAVARVGQEAEESGIRVGVEEEYCALTVTGTSMPWKPAVRFNVSSYDLPVKT